MARYQRKSYHKKRASGRRLSLTWLKGWWLPSHLMHPTKPTDCIYVEKIPKQCYLSCPNSQGVWKGVWWDKHSSRVWIISLRPFPLSLCVCIKYLIFSKKKKKKISPLLYTLTLQFLYLCIFLLFWLFSPHFIYYKYLFSFLPFSPYFARTKRWILSLSLSCFVSFGEFLILCCTSNLGWWFFLHKILQLLINMSKMHEYEM